MMCIKVPLHVAIGYEQTEFCMPDNEETACWHDGFSWKLCGIYWKQN